MRAVRLAVSIAALTPLVAGCSLLRPPPTIEKRFSAVAPTETPAWPVSLLVGSTAPKAESAGVAITALSDRGQAALITALAGKPPTKLKDKDEAGGDPRTKFDLTLRRRINIGVRPDDFPPPGDRIDALRLEISVDPARGGPWTLTGWTQATNGKEVIELGKLTRTAEQKLTAETGLVIAKQLPDAKIGYEASRTDESEMTIKDVTTLHAAVGSSGVAWLDEKGGWRDDLAHNLEIDVVLSANPAAPSFYVVVSDLRVPRSAKAKAAKSTKTGDELVVAEPGKVTLTETTVYAPGGATLPVCGIARLSYRVRHITNSEGTFTESDDGVEFRRGTAQTRFVLSPPPFKALYAIRSGNHIVAYQTGPRTKPLYFRSLNEAAEFANWLFKVQSKNPLSLGGDASIGMDDEGKLRGLTGGEYRHLIPVVANEVARGESLRNDFVGCTSSAAVVVGR